MSTIESIGLNLQHLMKENSVSIIQLAEYVGVSRQTMSNYIKGITPIDSAKLYRIAEFFKTKPSALLAEESSFQPAFLFRTALNYQDATDEIISRISEYILIYRKLLKFGNDGIVRIPEHYNLSIARGNHLIDINHECQDYSEKPTPELLNSIRIIAEEQRRKLGAENANAIELMNAIACSGIHVIFVDLNQPKIYGLSVIDNSIGCMIFVNSNKQITMERKLFTVIHEYAHLILHRPLYDRKTSIDIGEKNLLDRMSNEFAGAMLCSKRKLFPYEEKLLQREIRLSDLIEIKHDLQISLSCLVVSLKSKGYLSNDYVNRYFRWQKANQLDEDELEPLSEMPGIDGYFSESTKLRVLPLVRKGLDSHQISLEEAAILLDVPIETVWKKTRNNCEYTDFDF